MSNAARGPRTNAALARAFAEEDLKINDDIANKILGIYKDAASVPTGYFEAKPMRVVSFDEVTSILAPDNAPEEIINKLQNYGFDVRQYKAGDTDDRRRVLNEAAEEKDVKFMVKADSGENKKNSYDEAHKLYKGKDLANDGEVYDYDFLVSLPDMKVTHTQSFESMNRGRMSKEDIAGDALNNAAQYGKRCPDGVILKNDYTGKNLKISKNTAIHSLKGDSGRLMTNIKLALNAGELAKNAVPLNALINTSKDRSVTGTYAMAAYTVDDIGRETIAILTVEERDGEVVDIAPYDTVHAVSGRKIQQNGQSGTNFTRSSADSIDRSANTISIAQLLDLVNSFHRSLLSKNVLKHYDEERPADGYYNGKVKFMVTAKEDDEYMKAVEDGDEETQRRIIDQAANSWAGEKAIRAYHGTGREDRVGTRFIADRATSGPMAFFTDSREIAEGYSRTKADTSLTNEGAGEYKNQFKAINKTTGEETNVYDL